MKGLGPKDEGEGAEGGTGREIGPEKAAGGTMEGATEVMEGMAVGGKSCCPITVRLPYGGNDTARSQVAAELQICSHNYYCHQLFISWLLLPRLSSSHLLVVKLNGMVERTPHAIPL